MNLIKAHYMSVWKYHNETLHIVQLIYANKNGKKEKKDNNNHFRKKIVTLFFFPSGGWRFKVSPDK
jgi:hypothetical protein